MSPIWIHLETVPPPFEGESTFVRTAEVQVPFLGSFLAGPIEVQTYASEVLRVHALRRLINAEQILLSCGSHRAGRHSHQWRQHAHEAWAHAMLELVLLYDLHIAAQNAIREDCVASRSPSDRAGDQDRRQHRRRLQLGADLSEIVEVLFEADRRLFLDVYDFLGHASPSRVAHDLVCLSRQHARSTMPRPVIKTTG